MVRPGRQCYSGPYHYPERWRQFYTNDRPFTNTTRGPLPGAAAAPPQPVGLLEAVPYFGLEEEPRTENDRTWFSVLGSAIFSFSASGCRQGLVGGGGEEAWTRRAAR